MKHPRRGHIFIIICISLIVFYSLSCSKKNGISQGGESKITILCSGNERMAFASTPNTNKLLFLPLVVNDEKSQPKPRLLERWEHSENHTEWTFYLRKDIHWQDGKPVTAHDVKFTLEFYTDPKLLYEGRFFDEIIVVDDFTCRLHSSTPFYALIYSAFGILPSHILKELDVADYHSWDFWSQPLGNGPYRYMRHIPDIMVELEANPLYYGPQPKIKQIVLKFGGNSLTELMSGNVDVVAGMRPIEIHQIRKENRFDIYYEFDVTDVCSILWNHNNQLFRNPLVRQALTQAINRKELYQILNYPKDTPIFYVAITPTQFTSGEIPNPLAYDPQKAAKLLDNAGWLEAEKEEIREESGQKFHFSLFSSPENLPSAVYIQELFRKVGVEMEAVTMELSALVGRIRESKFDALLQSFGPFGYGWGYGGYDNPEFDRLQKSFFDSATMEGFNNVAKQLWPIFQSDIPWPFLYLRVTFNVAHRRIKGLKSPNYPIQSGSLNSFG